MARQTARHRNAIARPGYKKRQQVWTRSTLPIRDNTARDAHSSGPGAVVESCCWSGSHECRRGPASGIGEDRFACMALSRCPSEEVAWRGRRGSHQLKYMGQRRATEQQGAITALCPQCVITHACVSSSRMFCTMMGMAVGCHVHRCGHGHRHARVLIHRHRLGNQWADKNHQHGEQAQPCAPFVTGNG